MKKMLLALALLGLSLPAMAAEPLTPEVKLTDAPEVTDPDLKDALPVARQGSDEPLGGFKERGRKGSGVAFIGLSRALSSGVPVLGWRYWLGEHVAVQAALGGSYQSRDNNKFRSNLSEELGLRFALNDLGQSGFLFLDLRGGARQEHETSEDQTTHPGYVQFASEDTLTNSYGLAASLGAELFWPGSKRVSLEASAGLGATWLTRVYQSDDKTDDGTSGVNSKDRRDNSSFDFGVQYSNLLVALNLYY